MLDSALKGRLAVEHLRICATASGSEVVDEVTFTLAAGQTLGLVGESGSGKTTVALALLGHARRGLRIEHGTVRVEGVDVLSLSDRHMRLLRGKQVAYVPQDPTSALNPALKIRTQLGEVIAKVSHDGERTGARQREVLEEVRLTDPRILDAYPHQLSGGQQQRVALAMAFALRPSVIVLDEPTTGLDVTTQRRVLDTIRSLCAIHGVAAVFVSHDLAVIGELADHVAVMYAGRIVEIGTRMAVLGSPTHPYTRALLRAVPSSDRSRGLIGLTGQPPRPGHRPRGCAFAPRCQLAGPACNQAPPPPVAVGDPSHLVRCIRTAEVPLTDLPGAVSSVSSAAAGADALLRVGGLSASYGPIPILHDVSWSLGERECLAIVGESGSGKTTLARCIVGLHERWTGTLTWRGGQLPAGSRRRPTEALQAIQYVFQNPYSSLNPRRRIEQIIEQPLDRFTRLGRAERRTRIVEALESASLDATFLDRYPAELSGGERQRGAIARALVVEPQILVCDEITSALDVSVQAVIVEMLRRLQRERGLALVFITHNLALVRSIAQSVVVMHEGRVVEAGPCEAVLDHPSHEYTRRLLGDLPGPPTAGILASSTSA